VFFGRFTNEAKAICNSGCPVKEDCLRYAMADLELKGVWGGTTHSERKQMQLAIERKARRAS
jgi:WhiB family transcriptional regulator, redox-sensing transcriptional regulator